MASGVYIRTEEAKKRLRGAFAGKHHTKEAKRKMKKSAHRGDEHHNWKGINASYQAIHHWITRQFEQPKFCEHCGATEAKKYEWANISGKYKREREDWLRLCTSCHHALDNTLGKAWATRKGNVIVK